MINLQNNQKGFSVVESLLLILVIAVIGFGGYYVWHTQHDKSKPTAIKTTVSTTTKNTSKPTSTVPTNSKVLTITEWGVKVPYVSTDTLSYEISTTNSNLAIIISKNMSDNYGCTGANDQDSGAGGIYRALATSVDSDTNSTTQITYSSQANTDPTDFKQVGSYVYTFSHDQAACSNQTLVGSPGETAQGNAEKFTNTLIPSIESN